ncbi:MAG: phosphatase PAP2 family protein [bacterium]
MAASAYRARHTRRARQPARVATRTITTVAMGLGTPASLPARLQYRINKLTKWVVSASVCASLVLRGFDALTQWYIVGGVVSAILCRWLKFAINASRPGSSYRSDPGMPSSHASTLGFLSVFPYVMMSDNRYAWLLPAGGGFLAYLRVSQGYHTHAQVIVGWLLGTSIAVAWREAGRVALPYLAQTAAGRVGLAAACLFFMGLFTVKNVMYVMYAMR